MQISAALEVLTTLYSEDGELFLRFGEAIERFAERAANALAMMLVAHQVHLRDLHQVWCLDCPGSARP